MQSQKLEGSNDALADGYTLSFESTLSCCFILVKRFYGFRRGHSLCFARGVCTTFLCSEELLTYFISIIMCSS